MNEDIYKPPQSQIEKKGEVSGKVKMYSPIQAAVGTIGGPVGVVYFLMANFEALGQAEHKQKTLVIGVVSIIALAIILPFLPESVPSMPFTIAYILIAYQVTNNYQMSKAAILDSDNHNFHSNWRVLGIGLLCLVGSIICLAVPMLGVMYLNGEL